MTICIYGQYEVIYTNNYSYINEDGDFSSDKVQRIMNLDGMGVLDLINKFIYDYNFCDITLGNIIKITLFDETSGESDDIEIQIKRRETNDKV